MMKAQVLFALLMASAVIAQNNTAPQFRNNFWACTNAKNTYCTDGICYTNITDTSATKLTNKAVNCSKNFTRDIFDTAYPVTYNNINSTFNITSLEHFLVGSLNLKAGETARYWFTSKAEKSAFVELNYTNSTQNKKDLGQYVQMLVFNNRKELNKVFNMSIAEKVLLPQSADIFTIYLIAQPGSNYNIDVMASNALKTIVSSLFLVMALLSFAL